MRNAPRARGPDEPQRDQTGDLNAYDTLYRSVLSEYPNLSTSELSARFGVIGSVLATIHRFLRAERERLRPRVANLSFDRERSPHLTPLISIARTALAVTTFATFRAQVIKKKRDISDDA